MLFPLKFSKKASDLVSACVCFGGFHAPYGENICTVNSCYDTPWVSEQTWGGGGVTVEERKEIRARGIQLEDWAWTELGTLGGQPEGQPGTEQRVGAGQSRGAPGQGPTGTKKNGVVPWGLRVLTCQCICRDSGASHTYSPCGVSQEVLVQIRHLLGPWLVGYIQQSRTKGWWRWF